MNNSILVIDDINDNLISVKALLNDIFPEFQVSAAMNGRDGLNLASIENPDVILLDIIMPEMDGFEVCRLLKEDPLLRDIPVLFFTSMKETKENRINSLKAGAEGFISKPIDKIELEAQIKAMLKIRAANILNLNDTERLSKLVAQRTEDLEQSRVALLNILEDLKLENEERKQAEQNLIQNQYYLKKAQEIGSIGAWELDLIKNELIWTDETYRIFGLKPGTLLTYDTFINIVHPKDRILVGKNWKDTIEGEPNDIKYRLLINGDTKWVHQKAEIFYDEKGKAVKAVGFAQDITETKTAQIKEEIFKNKLLEAQKIAGIGTWDYSFEEKCSYWSPEMYRIFGLDENYGPIPWLDHKPLIHPDDWERIDRVVNIAFTKGTSYREQFRIVNKNGSIVWAETRGNGQIDEKGNVISLCGTVQDITERKQAEETLIDGEAKYKALFDNTSDAIFIYNPETYEILQANEATSKLYGYDKNELIGMSCLKFSAEVDNSKTASTQIVKDGYVAIPERHHKKKDGSDIYVQLSGHKVIVNGHDVMFAVCRDITNRKQAEEALKSTLYELKKSQEVAKVGSWVWYVPQSRVVWSEEMYRIFSINKNLFTGNLAQVINESIHPDDRAEVNRSNASVMEKNQPIPLEYRIVRPDGSIRTVWAEAGELELDDEGKPKLLRGIVHDITERKRLEQDLIQQKNYLEKILQTTSDGFWVVTPDKKIADANPAYCQMSGYTIEELARMEINDLDGIENPQETTERIKRITKNGSEIFETKHRRKDGSVFDIEISASLLDQSEEMRLVCFCRDTTERKQAEEIIKKQLAEKKILLREVHHRIKNNMNIMKGILLLQAGGMSDKTAITAFEDAASRMDSMAILYDQLYQSSGFTELSIRKYVSPLADAIISNFPGGSSVKIEKHIDDIILDAKRLQPIGIIINELLTNIMKYAFIEKSKGIIMISAILEKGHVIIVVQDNGIGIPMSINLENSSGFGLILVHALAGQIDANILIERKGGTRFVLDILL